MGTCLSGIPGHLPGLSQSLGVPRVSPRPEPRPCLQSPWLVWTHAGSGPLGLVISKCPRRGRRDCPWVWGWPFLLDPATSLGRCHGSSCPWGPPQSYPSPGCPCLTPPGVPPSALRSRVPALSCTSLYTCAGLSKPGRGEGVYGGSIRHIFLQFADFHLLVLAFLIFQRRRELLNLPVNLVPSISPSSPF